MSLKRIVLQVLVMATVSAFGGDLDVARQALADGVWRSALAAADAAAVTTNTAELRSRSSRSVIPTSPRPNNITKHRSVSL